MIPEETKKKIEEAAKIERHKRPDFTPTEGYLAQLFYINGANFGYSLAVEEYDAGERARFIQAQENLIQSLQSEVKDKGAEISRLEDERDNAIKAMDHHINCDMTTQERNSKLESALKVAEDAIESLYGKIKHGDDQHRHWLRDAVKNHFSECLQSIRSMREGKKL